MRTGRIMQERRRKGSRKNEGRRNLETDENKRRWKEKTRKIGR
jgi:hypothetical protein